LSDNDQEDWSIRWRKARNRGLKYAGVGSALLILGWLYFALASIWYQPFFAPFFALFPWWLFIPISIAGFLFFAYSLILGRRAHALIPDLDFKQETENN
jgi:hypothetical protein